MDEFLKEISGMLEKESAQLSINIEPLHKKLISKSYNCMSDCFLQPESIEACGVCAETCHGKVRRAQDEVQEKIAGIQKLFQKCVDDCGLHSSQHDSAYLKTFINECSIEATSYFHDANSIAQAIMNKYMD